MYALYKKCRKGLYVEVVVIAVSESKEDLMALLPYEVEKYVRATNKEMLPDELSHYLHDGHKPREFWSSGPFNADEFEVVEVPYCRNASLRCFKELNELREENKKYLASIGIKA